MSEVNFGAGATAVETPAAETQQETTSETSQAVARPVTADYVPSFKDIILPTIQVAHPVGEIGKVHPHGSIVFDNRVLLYYPTELDKVTGQVKTPGTKPFMVTFVGFEKPKFAEKLPGGARGRIVDTEDAVAKLGGTLDYQEWELKNKSIPLFSPKVRSMVLIEKPEHLPDDGTVFVHEVEGKKYTLAFWDFKTTAYTAACKKVIFVAKMTGCLINGYPSFSFSASTRTEPSRNGRPSYLVPNLVAKERNSEKLVAFAKQVLQG